MICEGKGMIAPARHRIDLTVSLVNELISEAKRRDEFRNYKKHSTAWGKGLMRGGVLGLTDQQLPASARPILIGLGGEWAFLQSLPPRFRQRAGVDFSLSQLGDGGKDFELFGVRIDVKCRSQVYHGNRVRLKTASGWSPPLADAFVFCEWVHKTHIDVLGWATKGDLELWEQERPQAGHVNAKEDDSSLKPLRGLVALLDSQI